MINKDFKVASKKFKVTQQDFDDANKLILGEDQFKFVKSRTSRANYACQEAFMQKYDDNPKYKKACAILREGQKRLNKDGQYNWDK